MKQICIAAFCMCVLWTATPANAQVVELSDGVVEFIGLDAWTVAMIKDSLAVHSPGTPIDQCAVTLKEKLGFADAAVQRFRDEDGGMHTLITLVEPQHADRVNYKPFMAQTTGAIVEWQPLLDIFDQHPREFQVATGMSGFRKAGDQDTISRVLASAEAEHVERMWMLVEERNRPEDFELAVWTLNNDPNYKNRAVAAVLLANFPERELAWWTLLDAQRDPVGPVSAAASQAMRSMAIAGMTDPSDPSGPGAYAVDWRPARHSVRDVLDGTNLFGLHTVMLVLEQTGVSPELAPFLLERGGTLLLANLGVTREDQRMLAHRLLVQLRGEDLGQDVAPWQTWIESLTEAKGSP